MILPEGFNKQGDYVVTDAYGDWCVIWKILPFDLRTRLSAGERRKVFAMGDCFLTPAFGRQGWNVRKSFPKKETARKMPFVMVQDGQAFFFATRGNTTPKRTA